MKTNRYEELVADLRSRAGNPAWVVDDAVGAIPPGTFVRSFYVRPETLFDRDSVYESLTCYAVTDSSLVIIFSEVSYEFHPDGELLTSVQRVPLAAIKDYVVLRRRVLAGEHKGEISAVGLLLHWGTSWTSDILPAGCDDPSCTADHGSVGRIRSDDVEILVDRGLSPEVFESGEYFIDELHRILMGAEG